MYDWANSPVGGVALILFMPIFIARMATNVAYNNNPIPNCSDVDDVNATACAEGACASCKMDRLWRNDAGNAGSARAL